MKLATLKDGSRDGQLVVVSRDLSLAHHASGIASRMQQLLDDWNFLSPQLEDLYATLNGGKARHAFPFEPRQCMAPLPRAVGRVDGMAWLSHVARSHRARGTEPPANMGESPILALGAGDLQGPRDDAVFADASWGIDFEAGLAVVTGDVARGASAGQALDGVRLLMLCNAWSLRELIPAELARGYGSVLGRPSAAFGPVAVTPDELGDAWRGGRLDGAIEVHCNDRRVGRLPAARGMDVSFGQLISHAARTRPLGAGTVFVAAPVDSEDPAAGFACIAAQRDREALAGEPARTAWLAPGDTVRVEATDAHGQSLFGAIEQTVRVDGSEPDGRGSTARSDGRSAGSPALLR